MGINRDPQLDSVQGEPWEHSALSEMSVSYPSMQGSGISTEEGAARLEEQRLWVTPRKRCLPVTAGRVSVNSQGVRHILVQVQASWGPSPGRGGGTVDVRSAEPLCTTLKARSLAQRQLSNTK